MTLNTTLKIFDKFKKDGTINVSFPYPKPEIFSVINALFSKILAQMDKVYLLDTVITIIKEIIFNAVKANAKRAYFQKNSIDINNNNDYLNGMNKFKAEVVGELGLMERDLKLGKLKVNLIVSEKNDGLLVAIINNSSILPEEQERINMRKARAIEYNDFAEAYDDIYDETEGAGLGIVLTTLLMKNSGIDVDSYKIISNGELTRVSFKIPETLKPVEVTTKIKEQIINEARGIPTFPRNIVELQNLCNIPDASMNEISKRIMLDPALSSDVLKLSNSAGFISMKRIENINEAVVKIGLKNIQSILIATSARRILDQRFTKFEQIWLHCNKTAFYARNIALKYKLKKVSENAYLAGLLHDIGKIILLSVNLHLTNWIADFVKNRKIRISTVMEEVSIGISHSAIGKMVAEKWNFPDYLVEAIEFHHAPLNASIKFRDLMFSTYLANIFCGIEARRYKFHFTESEVLERFNLSDEASFKSLHEELKNMFVEQSKLSA